MKKLAGIFIIALSPFFLGSCASVIVNLADNPTARQISALPKFFDLSRDIAPIRCAEFDFGNHYKSCEFAFPSVYSSGSRRNDTVEGRLYIPVEPKSTEGFIVLPGSGENISSSFFAEILARLGYPTVRLYAGFRPLPDRVVEHAARLGTEDEAISFAAQFFKSAMRQRVVDVMRIADYLESAHGIARLHVVGNSLGGIVGNLFAAVDPRAESLMMILASADLARIVAVEGSEMQRLFHARFRLSAQDLYVKLNPQLALVEPLTYRERLPRKILLVSGFLDMAGLIDTIIPFSATLATWRAYGRPEWIIIGPGHFTSIATMLPFWLEFPHLHHLILTGLQPYASHILVEHFLPLALR